MKKVLIISVISSILLNAGSPIHDLMDNRVKGKSFGGTTDDNTAAEDGLGVLPLQHHSGTTEVNNELKIQKIFSEIEKRENDSSKIKNIRETILSGSSITPKESSILNQVGFQLSYQAGSLTSCSDIKTNFPTSTTGVYQLSSGLETCDMSGSGVMIYTNSSLNSCKEILEKFPTSLSGIYDLKLGKAYCDMTTDGGGWTNIGYKIGSTIAITGSLNGISTSSTSESPVNGTLQTMYRNNGCPDNRYETTFSTELIDNVPFTEVYLNTKSYGGGDIRCGGVLRHVAYDGSVTPFTSFHSGALGRCDNDYWYGGPGHGFSEERNTSDLKFKYTLRPGTNKFAVLGATCGAGYSYLKINQVMVR